MTNELIVEDTRLGTLPNGTELIAATLASGRALLTRVDPFVRNQSRFDRQARTGLTSSALEVTQAIYLDYVSSQVAAWTRSEVAALQTLVEGIAKRAGRLKLSLPPQVRLVKTTGLEEGFAAYTRGPDVVVLPSNMVASLVTTTSFGDPLHPSDQSAFLGDVITHELFHIMSKHDLEKRRALYAMLHYEQLDQAIALPDTPWGSGHASMAELKITNPDTPELDVYIELEVPESPDERATGKLRRPLMPVLLASGPYAGGSFFDYLQWWFLQLEKGADGSWRPAMHHGRPVMHESAPLLEQYRGLVGSNFSGEIFHPDEICAQSFVLTVDQPDMGLLCQMQQALRGEHR